MDFIRFTKGGRTRVIPMAQYLAMTDEEVTGSRVAFVSRREAIKAAAEWRRRAN